MSQHRPPEARPSSGDDPATEGHGPGGVTVRQSASGAAPGGLRPSSSGGVVASRADVLESQLCELAGLVHAANAQLMDLLAELDQIGGWQGTGIRSLGHWAAINLGIDARTADRQATAGRRLHELPAIAAACRSGELGWAKARLLTDVAVSTTDERWLGLAREMSVSQLARMVAAYRRASSTDDPDRLEKARRRRGIWLFDQPDGLVRISALLEPDDAAVLRAALAAQVEATWRSRRGDGDDAAAGNDPTDHDPTDDDPTDDDPTQSVAATGDDCPADQHARPSEVDPHLTTRDTFAAREADALVGLLRTALAAGDLPTDGDDLTQVVLHVDAEVLAGQAEVGRCHLAHGPAVATPTARRLACDALVQPLLHRRGTPLALGRSRRLVTRAQRRALHARDRGCAFPGCTATRHLDAHHIVHWADGGRTDLDNLVMLCRFHHRLHHEGGYRIGTDDDRPRFGRPDGTPIRPPVPRHLPGPAAVSALRRRSRPYGPPDRWTPRARSGGAPVWSVQAGIDSLAG